MSFVSAYAAAQLQQELVHGNAGAELIKENWARVTEFPDILFQAVQLPKLSELEAKSLGVKSGGAELTST
jgi:hypothetical protein